MTFAADQGLKQISLWLVGELELDRQGGVEVGVGLEHQRHAVVTRCGEAIEV